MSFPFLNYLQLEGWNTLRCSKSNKLQMSASRSWSQWVLASWPDHFKYLHWESLSKVQGLSLRISHHGIKTDKYDGHWKYNYLHLNTYSHFIPCHCESLSVWTSVSVKVCQCESLSVWKSVSVKVCQCESMSVWKSFSVKVCQCESLSVWKSVIVKVCQCESLLVWKCVSVKVCQCESLSVWKSVSVKVS